MHVSQINGGHIMALTVEQFEQSMEQRKATRELSQQFQAACIEIMRLRDALASHPKLYKQANAMSGKLGKMRRELGV